MSEFNEERGTAGEDHLVDAVDESVKVSIGTLINTVNNDVLKIKNVLNMPSEVAEKSEKTPSMDNVSDRMSRLNTIGMELQKILKVVRKI